MRTLTQPRPSCGGLLRPQPRSCCNRQRAEAAGHAAARSFAQRTEYYQQERRQCFWPPSRSGRAVSLAQRSPRVGKVQRASCAAVGAGAEALARGETAEAAANPLALVLADRELWLIYGNIVLYAVCFNLQAPVMPALTQSFGSTPEGFGTLMSLFALVQLVGGLMCGPLMDVNGPKWGFMVSYLSGAAAYGMQAFATSMPLLYLSRLPMAAQHAALAARIAVSAKATSTGAQAALLGYISLAYSVGAVVGPVLGGALASHSLRIVSLVAAGLSVLSAASIALGMPASCCTNRRVAQQPHPTSPVAEHGVPPPPPPPPPPAARHSKLSLADFRRVATLQGAPSLLATKGVMSLVLALFHGVFALAASTHFGLSPAATGAVLSAMSVITMVTQAFVIDWAVARFPPRRVFAVNAAAMAASLVGLAASTHMSAVMVFLIPLSVSSCVLSTLNTAQLNAAAGAGDRGSMNAIDMSVSSGVRVFSPALGTWMLARAGFGSIGAAGALLMAGLLITVEAGARRAEAGRRADALH